MAVVRMEAPSGTVNGVNKVFTTVVPYVSGSLKVWNALLRQEARDDGWTETTSTSFTMKEAPKTGDVLLVYYEEA